MPLMKRSGNSSKVLFTHYHLLTLLESGNTVDLLAMIYTSVEMFIYEFGDYRSIPAEVKMLRALTILRWIRGFRFSVFNRGRKVLELY